jgi:hypothetical protein
MPCTAKTPVAGCPGPWSVGRPDTRCAHCQLESAERHNLWLNKAKKGMISAHAVQPLPVADDQRVPAPPPKIGFPQASTIPSITDVAMNRDTQVRLVHSLQDAAAPLLKSSEMISDEEFVTRLVDAALVCRAGARTLLTKDFDGDSPTAAKWRAVGLGVVVDEDTKRVKYLYATIGHLLDIVRERNVSKKLWMVLSKPLGTDVGEKTFEAWAPQTMGNCAKGGSLDCLVWAKAICDHTGVDFKHFALAIEKAHKVGMEEYDDFMKRTYQLESSVAGMKIPNVMAYAEDLNGFLRKIVELNKAVPLQTLKQEWDAQRAKVVALKIEDDKDLIKWDEARKALSTKPKW